MSKSMLYRFKTIFKKKYRVNIYNNNGSKCICSFKVFPGDTAALPSLYTPNTATLLGYSLEKNQHNNPSYYVGQEIKVTKNMNFYEVLYPIQKEESIHSDQLPGIEDVPYDNIIFVGDSRTHYIFERELVKVRYPKLHDHIYHIALISSGLDWLKSTAYSELLDLLDRLNSDEVQKTNQELLNSRTAIIFNHGVNDLFNCDDYMIFMKQIAPELLSRNCKLFYMSINPCSYENRAQWNRLRGSKEKAKKESELLVFNHTLKDNLCSSGKDYTYIDTYTYLINTGFSYHYKKKNPKRNDGLHYTAKTEKRIYRYVMDFI